MNTNIASLYDYALQKMASEAYLEGIDLSQTEQVRARLLRGSNRQDYRPGSTDGLNQGYPGYTRMTNAQAKEFNAKFRVIHQWSDDPTTKSQGRPDPEGTYSNLKLNKDILANTGLSATLIRKLDASGSPTNSYTLSIRSTEFRDWDEGGDAERDKWPTDGFGIAVDGFALAQLSALEKYFQWLKDDHKLPDGAQVDVTGYSLGGHLATVFTEMHRGDQGIHLGQTVAFNAPGRGT